MPRQAAALPPEKFRRLNYDESDDHYHTRHQDSATSAGDLLRAVGINECQDVGQIDELPERLT